jgi:Flp pilus assembly protein TadG
MNDKRAERNGQNLIELALILPVLILILTGTVDLGRAMQAYIGISQAAREGARYGSLGNGWDAAGMQSETVAELQRNGLAAANATVAVTTANTGSPVRVTVTYRFALLMAFWRNTPINLSSSAEMVVI